MNVNTVLQRLQATTEDLAQHQKKQQELIVMARDHRATIEEIAKAANTSVATIHRRLSR